MKSSKNGFTLVELLAVVTMIGIILTLATTATMKIMDRGRKRVEKLTAKNYITAVNDYNKISDVDKKLKSTGSNAPCTNVSGAQDKIKCNIANVSAIIKDSISGNLPESGYVYIDTTNYEVYFAEMKVKRFNIVFSNGKYNIVD